MPFTRRNERTRRWLAACLLSAGTVAGCQSRDADEYQTFEQKQRGGYDPNASFAEDEQPVDDAEPILAELAPETTESATADEPPVDALAPVNLADVSNAADILRTSASIEPSADGGRQVAAVGSTDATPSGPRQVRLLVTERSFRPEGPQQALRITYDDLDLLKVLNMEPVTVDAVERMPDWLKQLDGRTIRIRGFMFPTFESTGIERFVLARDAEKCCFGPNAKVYDLIGVEMKPGKTCDYIHLRPFDVIGTLHIEMQADGDEPLGLYHIDDAELVTK